jgi:hypothetical protein
VLRIFSGFALLFSALYMAFGVASPFLPAFLSSRGLAAEQVGLALSLAMTVRLSTMIGPHGAILKIFDLGLVGTILGGSQLHGKLVSEVHRPSAICAACSPPARWAFLNLVV